MEDKKSQPYSVVVAVWDADGKHAYYQLPSDVIEDPKRKIDDPGETIKSLISMDVRTAHIAGSPGGTLAPRFCGTYVVNLASFRNKP